MAYATPSDVAALNKSRVIGQGQNPTLTDVQTYINMTAAEIDGILIDKGYAVPIPSQYTGAWNLLNSINAHGAFAMMEEAAAGSQHADRARKAYEDGKQMLEAAKQVMDAPKNVQRAEPRGPWLTSRPTGQVYNPGLAVSDGPCNDPAAPFFSRQQRF